MDWYDYESGCLTISPDGVSDLKNQAMYWKINERASRN